MFPDPCNKVSSMRGFTTPQPLTLSLPPVHMEWSVRETVLPHPLQHSNGVGLAEEGQVLVSLVLCRQFLYLRVVEYLEALLTGLAEGLFKHSLIEQ